MPDSNRTIVSIKMKPYLKAFFLSLYPEQQQPIFIPKRDKLNNLLAHLLAKPPRDYVPPKPGHDENLVYIQVPYFNYMNHFYFTYLSKNSQKIFEESVRNHFIAVFIDHMLKSYILGMTRNQAITVFIEKWNLPLTAYIEEMLTKMVYRHMQIKDKYPKRKYEKQS